MFLKKMILKGFKSFADRTEIKFNDGLTVIVGPNGSGKSNINDALKWVLGETSKKTLRASTSKDMIFTGSLNKGPADFAEVTLFFDNVNRRLDVDEDEISITRKSYREKDQNEYYINGELVRRKDVKKLFLDTGLGNTDLSIISQGSVSKVTEAKPLEIKNLLNEAAGVSKYQIQKKESILKLEKVSSSLEIFDTKLKVLSRQIKPLKEASGKAQEYKKIKDELTKIELPIIKYQLKYEINRKEELENSLNILQSKKELYSKSNDDLRKSNSDIQLEIVEIDKKINSLEIKKTELQNASSFGVNSGDKKTIEEKIKQIAKSINDLKNIIKNSKEKEVEINSKISVLKREDFEYVSQNEQIENNRNKIKYELTKLQTESSNSLKHGVKMILENKSIFSTVYGVVDQIISYDEKYKTAINTAIGSKLNNIVVNNEKTVKDAVKFLKDNKYGTATFIPAENVQRKSISEDLISAISRITGFFGSLSKYIKSDKKFDNVISSLSENILLFDELKNALPAAKFINYRLTIVTLEGDIIYPGFTVKGGYSNLNYKKERIDKLINAEKLLTEKYEKNNVEIQRIRDDLRNFGSERNTIQNEEIRISERLNYLETQMQQSINTYKSVTGEDFDMGKVKTFIDSVKDSLSLEEIINSLRNLKQRKITLSNELINIQEQQSQYNKDWAEIIENISNNKLEINSLETNINNNLEILNKDYKITYDILLKDDKIKEVSKNLEKINDQRTKLREEINNLGYIDFEAIKKYDELESEYNELEKNTNDLRDTKDKLLSTIEIMDKEMINRIQQTFDEVNIKFNTIFRILFRGGEAKLIFIEPENILESGIEINATAPGKRIKNLTLYSGGEKSLIALSLIFAINEVRNLPLLLLDEVEAALDEANVERFAKFAKTLNENTQLIIVSHRPGTMEKADFLYGVTMQQKGITNIYNVKLEEAIEIAD